MVEGAVKNILARGERSLGLERKVCAAAHAACGCQLDCCHNLVWRGVACHTFTSSRMEELPPGDVSKFNRRMSAYTCMHMTSACCKTHCHCRSKQQCYRHYATRPGMHACVSRQQDRQQEPRLHFHACLLLHQGGDSPGDGGLRCQLRQQARQSLMRRCHLPWMTSLSQLRRRPC